MSEGEERRRAVGICEKCGEIYSIRIMAEGEILPVGTANGSGCQCGHSEFRVLSDDPQILAEVESDDPVE